MKLTLDQALATVLNMKLVNSPVQGAPQMYAMVHNGEEVIIANCANMTFTEAVRKACSIANLDTDSNFAIFPMGSNREDYYMSIEREMLRQEAHANHKMWEQMGSDPREIITLVMSQFRDCAVALTAPQNFQLALIRTGCLLIAALQWTNDWIGKLRLRDAALRVKAAEAPQIIALNSERKGL